MLIRQNIPRIVTSKSSNLQIVGVRRFLDEYKRYLHEFPSWKLSEESLNTVEIYLRKVERGGNGDFDDDDRQASPNG